MNTIIKALRFSAAAHDGQTRKGGDIPYIVHPYEVAMRAFTYTKNEDLISSALLHDVIEDCNVTTETLNKEFNSNITKLVNEVSHKEGNFSDWKEKKAFYCNQLLNISPDAAIITACDKMANMFAYGEKYKVDPDFVLKALKHSHDEWRWYYDLVFTNIKNILPEDVKNDYSKMFNEYFE